jgi:predicted transcriptional regulator
MSAAPGRPRGALERQVLACLAAADGPVTAGEVLTELGGDLAYTTVMTTLARLHTKGAVSRELNGRAYAYSLNGDEADVTMVVTAHRMRRLLEGGGNRAGVLARFVADLTPEDEKLLTDLLGRSTDEAGSA